ncbi:MAG: hypothetical protein EB130_09270 [Actinobacteria bacterium]|nr:hypothetical protein [Actinomycetota bacterium]
MRAVLLRWVPTVDFFEVAPRGDDVVFAFATRERREVVVLLVTMGRPPKVVNEAMAPETVPAKLVALARK